MEYWTIMWITALGGMIDGNVTALVYPSLASCEAALSAVSDTLPYDHNMLCEETTKASSSLRPKPNPFY
jgi:hypothetical protein